MVERSLSSFESAKGPGFDSQLLHGMCVERQNHSVLLLLLQTVHSTQRMVEHRCGHLSQTWKSRPAGDIETALFAISMPNFDVVFWTLAPGRILKSGKFVF